MKRKYVAILLVVALTMITVTALAALSCTGTNSITRSGNQITASATTTTTTVYDRVQTMVWLERKDSTNVWTKYSSYINSLKDVSSCSISHTYSVDSGFLYRVVSQHDVWNDGAGPHTVKKYSSTMMVP